AGNLLWTNVYGGKQYDYATSLVQTTDKGYAFTGGTNSFGSGNWDMYFVKTDSQGNSCNSFVAGGLVAKGGVVNTGGIESSGGSITSMDSGRIGNGGNRIAACSVITAANNISITNNSISVYPNPSNGIFQLEISNEQLGIKNTVEVYNVLGEQVYNEPVQRAQDDYKIDLSFQGTGVYFYRVLSDGKFVGSGKLVIKK
ncbi:MAG TPA: T9SS type A sorting domain-containing protein, partial [Bacteroidia bacterium]|nr:T9SS type A sorting domain-containing protein [Bacteroidia bacterium]